MPHRTGLRQTAGFQHDYTGENTELIGSFNHCVTLGRVKCISLPFRRQGSAQHMDNMQRRSKEDVPAHD